MKKLAYALVVTLATALAAPAAEAGSKTRTRTRIVGNSVNAEWAYTAGDIGTFVNVVVTDNDVSGTGGRSQDAFVSLAISRYQISTGNVLITGVAYVDGPNNFQFTIDRTLNKATLLVRNAIFQDDNSFTFFNVDMNLTWTATGDPITTRTRDKSVSPGMKVKTDFQGTVRDGIATGNIFGKNIQFTPVPSNSAMLQFNKFGSLEVTTTTK
jgi:hypothetical protein